VAVVGVGQIPFRSRYPDKTLYELAFEAARRAFADAGITARDVDCAVYSVYADLLNRQTTPDVMLQEYLGLNGKSGVRITDGAASSAYAARVGYAEVASGLSDIVLVLGVQKALDVYEPRTGHRPDAALTLESWTLDVTWELPYTVMPWGLVLTAHMAKYGTPTEEQIAKVAVKNHKNALKNPNAHLHMDVTVDEVLRSRLISWPTTMYEACLYGECAAAVIMASEERARELTAKPIWITGVGSCHHNCNTEMTLDNAGRLWSVWGAGQQAYRQAGITNPLEQLDLIELNDLVAGIEILSYEELGLCPLGEGGRLVDEGVTEMDGQLPVNPSGGRIAAGHIAGVSGVYSIGEVTLQLRGEAGERQVPLRRGRGLVSTLGGAGAGLSAALVLGVE
jgi:acetyl-CoA acetyltransferase